MNQLVLSFRILNGKILVLPTKVSDIFSVFSKYA